MKLQSKPKDIVEIDAIEYDGSNKMEIIDFIGSAPNFKYLDGHLIIMARQNIGWFVRKGDYVYMDKKGDAMVISPEEKLSNWIEI